MDSKMKAKKTVKGKEDKLKIKGSFKDVLRVAVSDNPTPKKPKKK
jgi:hypothetical protein